MSTISAVGSSGGMDIKEMASAFLKKADTNGDGTIDKSELKTVLSQGNTNSEDTVDISSVFAQVDTNSDGKIDASENENQMKKMAAQAPAKPPAGTAAANGTAASTATTSAGSSTGSGSASLTAAVSSSSSSTKTYDKKDLNKDGTVTYKEEIKYDMAHPNEKSDDKDTLSKLVGASQTQLDVTA